jgi:hypothetical protein
LTEFLEKQSKKENLENFFLFAEKHIVLASRESYLPHLIERLMFVKPNDKDRMLFDQAAEMALRGDMHPEDRSSIIINLCEIPSPQGRLLVADLAEKYAKSSQNRRELINLGRYIENPNEFQGFIKLLCCLNPGDTTKPNFDLSRQVAGLYSKVLTLEKFDTTIYRMQKDFPEMVFGAMQKSFSIVMRTIYGKTNTEYNEIISILRKINISEKYKIIDSFDNIWVSIISEISESSLSEIDTEGYSEREKLFNLLQKIHPKMDDPYLIAGWFSDYCGTSETRSRLRGMIGHEAIMGTEKINGQSYLSALENLNYFEKLISKKNLTEKPHLLGALEKLSFAGFFSAHEQKLLIHKLKSLTQIEELLRISRPGQYLDKIVFFIEDLLHQEMDFYALTELLHWATDFLLENHKNPENVNRMVRICRNPSSNRPQHRAFLPTESDILKNLGIPFLKTHPSKGDQWINIVQRMLGDHKILTSGQYQFATMPLMVLLPFKDRITKLLHEQQHDPMQNLAEGKFYLHKNDPIYQMCAFFNFLNEPDSMKFLLRVGRLDPKRLDENGRPEKRYDFCFQDWQRIIKENVTYDHIDGLESLYYEKNIQQKADAVFIGYTNYILQKEIIGPAWKKARELRVPLMVLVNDTHGAHGSLAITGLDLQKYQKQYSTDRFKIAFVKQDSRVFDYILDFGAKQYTEPDEMDPHIVSNDDLTYMLEKRPLMVFVDWLSSPFENKNHITSQGVRNLVGLMNEIQGVKEEYSAWGQNGLSRRAFQPQTRHLPLIEHLREVSKHQLRPRTGFDLRYVSLAKRPISTPFREKPTDFSWDQITKPTMICVQARMTLEDINADLKNARSDRPRAEAALSVLGHADVRKMLREIKRPNTLEPNRIAGYNEDTLQAYVDKHGMQVKVPIHSAVRRVTERLLAAETKR